jgi:hypothetical protein
MPKTLARQQRSRLITFRVTEAELAELISACSASEARSLSDFARRAALGCARFQGVTEETHPNPPDLGGTLIRLNSTLSEIASLLRGGVEDSIQPSSLLRDSSAPSRAFSR